MLFFFFFKWKLKQRRVLAGSAENMFLFRERKEIPSCWNVEACRDAYLAVLHMELSRCSQPDFLKSKECVECCHLIRTQKSPFICHLLVTSNIALISLSFTSSHCPGYEHWKHESIYYLCFLFFFFKTSQFCNHHLRS